MDGKYPDMKFSGVSASHVQAKNFHTFFCPCYILDSQLQDNPKWVPKWEPRACLGIYLSRSPAHAGNVALVFNPKSGLVSPQSHVVFGDNFSTIYSLRAGTVPLNWAKLVASSRELSTYDNFDVTKTWFQGQTDPTAGENSLDSTSNEGADFISNEGAHIPIYKGANILFSLFSSPVSEGDKEINEIPLSEDDLKMPEMINLNIIRRWRYLRLIAQLSCLT